MNNLLVLCMAAILLLVYGCIKDSTDELYDKYQLLQFNMSEDEICDAIGNPDIKLSEVIGETWIWKDDQGIDRIAVYVSPQMKWQMPETSITPRLMISTGRLIYKQWLGERGGAK